MGGGMMRGFGGGPLDLLRRADVQRELRMTDSQIDQVQELAQASRDRGMGMMDQIGRLRDASPEERGEIIAKMQESRRKQQEELREKAKDILNRNQQPRFAELEFQFGLQRGNLMGALAAAGVELDPEEAEKLRDTQRDIQTELREKITQLQKEANIEALNSVLDESKIEQLMGDSFTFEQEQRPFGQRGGDRAGAAQRGDRPAARATRGREGADRTDRRSRDRRRRD
jgi:hypothetical protein